ncbi:mitochondrial inner membrane protein OXA1-like [Salvia miltiorrhiza]|uniref:mitochondrial inner membrane protein OXA1-like n=1 Tax=Salvia miltiorrhiza TaxID=226208 RepID=UPI0025AD7BBE|nr:mitochondrial inner membrane protein OXA1-like [Salvia miltiorrhiza]
MAFRRSVTSRAKILYQQQRVAVPFSHIDRDDGDRENLPRHNPIYTGSGIPDIPRRRSPFGAGANVGGFCGSRLFQDRRFAIPAAFAPASVRKMSSLKEGPGADNIELMTDMADDKIGIMTDMADVLGETAAQVAQATAPVAGEVAAAAADSFFPVAALQYIIDYVHTFTGLNWWAAIVLTTVLIRTLQLPLTIHQIKATSKFTLIRPELEKIQEEMRSRDMSPAAVLEGQAKMRKIFNEYGVTPFTPLKGILIVGPVFLCFFLAITNMAEKVQSFKQGGAFWFTDLTTPDAMYILPVLTALTFWITVECNAQEGMEGNPAANTIKNVCRVFAVLTVPLTAEFSKAIFCYWITSNLYSLAYGLAIKKPEVKKMLGIPNIPPPPPSTNQKPALSFMESLKKYAAAQKHLQSLPPPTEQSLSPPEESSSPPADEMSKPVNRKFRTPSSALSRRIRNLEKEVKGRKKGSKRSSG